MFIDLHCHSTASDGTMPPREVVRLAKENGLSGMSMTDHDTVAGIPDAMDEAEKLGIAFIPGIEISAEYPMPGTLHILGYGVVPDSAVLKEMTATLIGGRDTRNPKIVDRLRELGVSITMQEVENEAKGAVIGRPHIAAILVRKGYVSSIKQAFDKYLAPGGSAYFDKERLSSRDALEFIHQAGGLSVVAHPVQLRTQNDAELESVLKNLVDQGLDGIEVIHSDHPPELIEKYAKLADRYGLLKTGGSDFHGRNKESIRLGFVRDKRVPWEIFENLKARLEKQKLARVGNVARASSQ